MKLDIFLSICQTEVDGFLPTERQMFESFFDQVRLADELGFGTAWVAETHLSCQVQKQNPGAVIPHFKGEIGLNTDILQLAGRIFNQTKRINVGSAIRNILCNGGPIAHAEAIKMFLTLHVLNENEKRYIDIGFASGRFPFSNTPYGIYPRNKTEEAAWNVIKGLILREATEIFLRCLRGDVFSSQDVTPKVIREEMFRSPEDWQKVVEINGRGDVNSIVIPPFWQFDKIGVIPFSAPLDLLKLTIGTHDAETQIMANQFMPVGVFNLSITPPEVIEKTHEHMREHYNPSGGPWQRWYMPRTAMVFMDNTEGASDEQKMQNARTAARKAWTNYWIAMEGTLDPDKVEKAVSNAIVGHPGSVVEQIKNKYHNDDRLMLWFDFNNHDNEFIKKSMVDFYKHVAPEIS